LEEERRKLNAVAVPARPGFDGLFALREAWREIPPLSERRRAAFAMGEEGVTELTKTLSTRRPLWQITDARWGPDLPDFSCLVSLRPDA
jgi:hypothetical protein